MSLLKKRKASEENMWHFHIEKIENGYLLDFENEGEDLPISCFKTREDIQKAISDLFKKHITSK